MLTESVCHRAELPPDEGKPILFVEFIETAPDSIPFLSDNPHYSGIGRRLMAGAISYSMEQGFEGRIGLLVLHQAEQFYLNIGFEKVRRDAKEGLYYFEWTAKAAQDFLDRGNIYEISHEQ